MADTLFFDSDSVYSRNIAGSTSFASFTPADRIWFEVSHLFNDDLQMPGRVTSLRSVSCVARLHTGVWGPWPVPIGMIE